MIQELRHALRTLIRQPGTTLVVVLTLAVAWAPAPPFSPFSWR